MRLPLRGDGEKVVSPVFAGCFFVAPLFVFVADANVPYVLNRDDATVGCDAVGCTTSDDSPSDPFVVGLELAVTEELLAGCD